MPLWRLLVLMSVAFVAGCGSSAGQEGPSTPSVIADASGPVFEDVTEAAGIAMVMASPAGVDDAPVDILLGTTGNGAAVGDYDGDGDLDLYLLGHRAHPNKLYRNELVETGEPRFTDVTPLPLADLGAGRVAHFADLDGDGDKDIVLINDDDGADESSGSKLFRNDAGAFVDATPGSGFRPVGMVMGGCSLADFDGDGLLDILVTVWAGGSHRLYRNRGAFVFEDVSGVLAVEETTYSSAFTDFDGDHRPDVYLAVDHETDAFFRNTPAGFVLATESVGTTHVGNDMGIAAADFDDDGDLDLFVTNITDSAGVFGTGAGNVLYVNQDDQSGVPFFVDEATTRGVFDTAWGWGTQWVDIENDGDLDLLAVTGFDTWVEKYDRDSAILGSPSFLFLNNGSGQFTRHRDEALDAPDDSRALIAFDYDRDGDLDMLVTNVNGPVRLLRNIAGKGNWLGVVLAPDADAVGAVVYATIGDVTKRRDVLAGGSYLSGCPREVHFGLNTTTQVDRVRVVWRDGAETAYEDVPVNALLRITR